MFLKHTQTILFLVCAFFIACGGSQKNKGQSSALAGSFDTLPVPATLIGFGELPNGADGALAETWAETIMPGQGPALNSQYVRLVDDSVSKIVIPNTNVDMTKPLRVFAMHVLGKDAPEPVLMAHALGELSAKRPGDVVTPVGAGIVLAGNPTAVAAATPFAKKLNTSVKDHRIVVYPKNALNNYKTDIQNTLNKVTNQAGGDAAAFTHVLKLYLETMISVGDQLNRIDMVMFENQTKIDIDMISVDGTNLEKFFLAQKPAAFDLANKVPTDKRPLYFESEWSMGEAKTPIMASFVEMMTALDDSADWGVTLNQMLTLLTGKNVGSMNINPSGKNPELDYTMAYENKDDAKTYELMKFYMKHFAESPKWKEITKVNTTLTESKTKQGTPFFSYKSEMGKLGELLATTMFAKNNMIYQIMGKNGAAHVETLSTQATFPVAAHVQKAIQYAKTQQANSLMFIDAKSVAGGMFPLELSMMTKGANGDLKTILELKREP